MQAIVFAVEPRNLEDLQCHYDWRTDPSSALACSIVATLDESRSTSYHSIYSTLFEEDIQVFNQIDWDVTTYAVVLLLEGAYYAHVYTWCSPIVPEICFTMGIRSRISHHGRDDKIPNVTRILFNEIKNFMMNCRTLYVTYPFTSMIPILEREGFQYAEIPVVWFGSSMAEGYLEDESDIIRRNCCQLELR